MLVMRGKPKGMVWQAYRVENKKEAVLIRRSAMNNGFYVFEESADYTEETSPGWRVTNEWKSYSAKYDDNGIKL